MTDQEILLAMSNMLSPIREDIQDIKTDISEVKDRLTNVEDRLTNVENDIVEVKERVTRIELTQENIIIPRLNTIESCYTSTYERYKTSVDEHESMKQDITILKQVVSEHSRKLQKIS